MKPYPQYICIECDNKHGRSKSNLFSTWHKGKCGICGKEADVTEPRDFGHLKSSWAQES